MNSGHGGGIVVTKDPRHPDHAVRRLVGGAVSPLLALDTSTVTALVEHAAAAPSMHNAQPWKFRYVRDRCVIQVRADLDRAIPRADRSGRALHLGCAAALFNLRVAAVHVGREPEVQLLPDPADPQLLAGVALAGPVGPSRDLDALFPAIHRRHTSRLPFADRGIPAAVRDALAEAARTEGAELIFPGAWQVRTLLRLVHDAEGRDDQDPAHTEELARWTHIGEGAGDAYEGVPEDAFWPHAVGGAAPVRDFAGRRRLTGRRSATFERLPVLALLGTAGDDVYDWMQAGQAMERVLLLATVKGVSTSLTSQALEWEDLRRIVRDPRTPVGHIQMIMRLGYGPEVSGTARRPVSDILELT
jgi:hypothetical protein